MTYVVLCGPKSHAPDRIVGPFDSEESASRWAAGQPGPPERYAVVVPLEPPPSP